jgi:hypothetical protein
LRFLFLSLFFDSLFLPLCLYFIYFILIRLLFIPHSYAGRVAPSLSTLDPCRNATRG